jgi:hypothetical protein
VELLEAWKRLDKARDRFLASVKADVELPAWCEGATTWQEARAAAVAAYSDFYYIGNESSNSVRRLIGLVGASPETARLAHELNGYKQAFAKCKARLQDCYMLDECEERHPLVRTAFRQLKIARINTLQATRQVVIVAEGLQRISWCIARKPRIKQVSREEAIAYIRTNPERRIRLAKDLAKLECLPPKTVLARFRPGSPIAIANATYINKWYKPVNRQYSSGMPLLIELQPSASLPPCTPPNRRPALRKPRPRVIERTYFVKALKLRRYLREPSKPARVAQLPRPLSQLFRGP